MESKIVNVRLPEDLKSKLKLVAQATDQKMAQIIRYSVEKIIAQEYQNPLQTEAIKEVIDRRFIMPSHQSPKAFLEMISLLAKNYPKDSSRDFWGDTVYVSTIDKTHYQVAEEVLDELKTYIEKKQQGE